MGWSGMKIPGHSGTQFKNRKAFKNKLKPIADSQNSNTTKQDIYHEYSYDELLQDRAAHKKVNFKVFLWICIPSVTLLLAYLSYMGVFFSDQNLNISEQTHSTSPHADPNSYQILVEAGFIALRDNRLYDAQLDFMQALQVDKYGKQANLGLTKTLSETCRQRGKFCEEAASYYDFTKKLEDVTEQDIKWLGVAAFF